MRKGGAGRVTQEKSAHLFTQKRKQAPSDVLFPLGGWKKLSCPIQPPTNEMPSNSRGPDQKNLPFLQANHHCLVAADKDTLAPILPSLRQERREGEKGKCAQEHLTQTCCMRAHALIDIAALLIALSTRQALSALLALITICLSCRSDLLIGRVALISNADTAFVLKGAAADC